MKFDIYLERNTERKRRRMKEREGIGEGKRYWCKINIWALCKKNYGCDVRHKIIDLEKEEKTHT